MRLILHELIHFLLSLLAALASFKIISKTKSKKALLILIFFGLIAGFLIDIDHFFDYFFAFGFNFKLDYFIQGFQFLKSDKLYIPIHSFELAIIFLIIYFFITKNRFIRSLFICLALSILFHLYIDIVANELPMKSYFFIYRLHNNFDLKKLVYPKHYKKHQQLKQNVHFED